MQPLRNLITVAVVAACAAPGAVKASACDATGTWRLDVRYEGRPCDPDEPEVVSFVVTRNGASYAVRDADKNNSSSLTFFDDGASCRLDREWDSNAVAYGTPVWSRYLFHLTERSGGVSGTGILHKLGSDLGNAPSCKQRFRVTGFHNPGVAALASTTGAPPGTTVFIKESRTHIETAPPTNPAVMGSRPAAACSDGKMTGADTQGHCCWAGQAYAASRGRCVGIPTYCAPPLHINGEECVAGGAAVAGGAGGGGAPPVNTGSAVTDAIADTLRQHEKQIFDCYRAELASHAGLTGGLELHMHINAQGRVTDADARLVTIPEPLVIQCIVGGARAWQFPRMPTGVEVSFPYHFAPPK